MHALWSSPCPRCDSRLPARRTLAELEDVLLAVDELQRPVLGEHADVACKVRRVRGAGVRVTSRGSEREKEV